MIDSKEKTSAWEAKSCSPSQQILRNCATQILTNVQTINQIAYSKDIRSVRKIAKNNY